MADPLRWLRDPEDEPQDALSWLRDEPAAGGAWQATASPNLQRRRKPDGSWEYRPTPREGAGPIEPPSAIDPGQHPQAAFGEQVLTRAAEGVASLGDLAGRVVEPFARAASYAVPPRSPGEALAAIGNRGAPLGDELYGDLADEREALRERYDLQRQRLTERLKGSPVLAGVADVGMDLLSDPTNLIPAGGGKVALRELGEEAAQRAARGAPGLVDEAAEEAAALARRDHALARLRPEDIERTLPVEPAPFRVGEGVPDAEIEQRLGMRASPEDAEELRRVSLAIGEDAAPAAPDPLAWLRDPPEAPGSAEDDLVLYRGTRRDSGSSRQVEYWSPDREVAAGYGDVARGRLPSTVKTLDLRSFGDVGEDGPTWRFLEAALGEDRAVRVFGSAGRRGDPHPVIYTLFRDADSLAAAREAGFDAIRFVQDGGKETVAVLRPGAVRSDAPPLAPAARVADDLTPGPTSPLSPPEIGAPGGSERGVFIRPEPRGTAVTERGSRVDFDYEVRPASSLVTSHDDLLRPNPAFPAEVQPRERSRVSRLDLIAGAAPPEQRALLSQAEAVFAEAEQQLATMPPSERLVRVEELRQRRRQPDLPGVPSASTATFRMSTKGIENSTGLQAELHDIVEANRPQIEAARGPVKPASRWHGAQALADDLGMTPEDFLATPAGKTFNDEELSLGRHYLGGMRQEVHDLAGKIARGEITAADLPAAKERLARLNVDTVRLMSTLQGQGSSTAGRVLRSLQEELDPFQLASTPRDRLQLALLKKYKEANAQTAQRIEQQAVARLKRQAARETRKAARAATTEELSTELEQLAEQFGSLSRRPRGMGGGLVPIDPDLVEVVGKMAANRVRAGVVAVEELADQVYTAVRAYAGDVTREQVKAAIVEHALARPGKVARVRLSPEQRRLQQAEAAAGRAVTALEKRIAAGGAPPTGQASPWSAKLADLKAKQAQLREQLAAMQPPKAAPDPEARRLRARETALARQVQKAEEQLAAGPRIPEAKAPAADSPRLQELRQQLAEVRGKLAADPKQALTQRYRELLDDQTVEMIAALPDPQEDPAALLNFLRQMERPTFRDFRTTYWINSILSGTKTTVRNLTGNVVRLAELTAMRPAGAAVEAGLARAQGRAPARLMRETLPATMGVFRGVPEGVKRFAFVMREGFDPRRIVSELTEGGANKFDQPLPVNPFLLSENRAVRAVGVPLTLPTRLLEATDALFKTMASTSEMYAGATRTAVREGLSGDALAARVADLIANPTDEMVESAHRFALRATYQDPASWIGNLASTARRGVPGSDELAGKLRARGGVGNRVIAATVQMPQTVMQHLVPFVHISDRVAASITDYIPLSKPGKLAAAFIPDDVWGGLPATAERYYRHQPGEAADFLARQTVGAALGMLGITWAAQGKLVGEAPKDEKLRNDFYAEGKQPYSLLIGDRWVPMRDSLGPWAGPFVAAAMYQDHVRAGEDPTAAIPGMALGSARYMLDASYLATLQQVVEAIESDRGDVGRGVSSAGARVAAGYVPFSGFVRGVAQATDVSTNALGQTGPRVVEREGFVDELKSGIPGLRQDLPSRVGTQGEELVQATGRAGAFVPFVPTPSRVSDPKLAERVEMMRATLAKKRTEIRRVEEAVKKAEKLGDAGRIQKLRARIPAGVNAAELDGTFERLRAEEQELRQVRSNRAMPRDARRQAEAAILARILRDLEYDLRRVGVSP